LCGKCGKCGIWSGLNELDFINEGEAGKA
jgi:hypothetical protein